VYSGLINGQVVFCCHPVVVLGRRGVVASFNHLDGALRLLRERGFGAGVVYRHNGSDWDKVEVDPREVFQQWETSR
jgi:hypothetical protein